MRTTLDIEKPVMKDLKELQRKTHQSLGKLASSLLAEALKQRSNLPSGGDDQPPLEWKAQSMGSRVNLQDKDALYRAMGEG